MKTFSSMARRLTSVDGSTSRDTPSGLSLGCPPPTSVAHPPTVRAVGHNAWPARRCNCARQVTRSRRGCWRLRLKSSSSRHLGDKAYQAMALRTHDFPRFASGTWRNNHCCGIAARVRSGASDCRILLSSCRPTTVPTGRKSWRGRYWNLRTGAFASCKWPHSTVAPKRLASCTRRSCHVATSRNATVDPCLRLCAQEPSRCCTRRDSLPRDLRTGRLAFRPRCSSVFETSSVLSAMGNTIDCGCVRSRTYSATRYRYRPGAQCTSRRRQRVSGVRSIGRLLAGIDSTRLLHCYRRAALP